MAKPLIVNNAYFPVAYSFYGVVFQFFVVAMFTTQYKMHVKQ